MGGGASSEASSEVSLVGHSGPILAVAFSASGEVVATGSKDCTARLYDAASGALKITLSGHGESVLSCAFSGDGGRVVTGGGDAAARVWDAASGETAATLDEKPRRSFFRRKEAGVDPFPDEPELDLDGSGDDESHGS
ncbi:WD repeat-containing protein [Aureococcus anophagefferens]|nr:WD repeat-containing protein [Aureococcus anophagefferens]